jgi:hypothetical protein
MEYFPAQQLKFVIFERFTQNIQAIVDEVCEFLGLRTTVETAAVDTHRNIGVAPWSLRLKLRANSIHRKTAERLYHGYLPTAALQQQKRPTLSRFIEHYSPSVVINKLVSLAPKRKYPPMANGVQQFLEKLYAKENRGLGELIGIDIERYWPHMTQ